MSGRGGGEHPVAAISALADGELRGSERAAIEAHVGSCASCRALLADLRRIADAIPDVAGPELPVGLEERVKTRLRAERAAPRHRRFVLPIAIAATLGALALVATVQVRQTRPLPETPALRSSASDPEDDKSSTDDRAVPESSNQAPRLRDEPLASRSESSMRRVQSAPGDAAKEQRAGAAVGPVQPSAAAPPPVPLRSATGRAADADQLAITATAGPPQAEKKKSELTAVVTAAPDRVDAGGGVPGGVAGGVTGGAEGGVAGGVVGGVAGGVLGGVERAAGSSRTGAGVPCSAPWEVPAEVVWEHAGTPDRQEPLASLAAEARGEAIPGRDARGAFVTLQLPAASWPRVLERLRELGAAVPAEVPALPEGTECVKVEVRLPI